MPNEHGSRRRVTQICNLPYRRFEIGSVLGGTLNGRQVQNCKSALSHATSRRAEIADPCPIASAPQFGFRSSAFFRISDLGFRIYDHPTQLLTI